MMTLRKGRQTNHLISSDSPVERSSIVVRSRVQRVGLAGGKIHRIPDQLLLYLQEEALVFLAQHRAGTGIGSGEAGKTAPREQLQEEDEGSADRQDKGGLS